MNEHTVVASPEEGLWRGVCLSNDYATPLLYSTAEQAIAVATQFHLDSGT